jgi:hypothetical protein
MIKSEDVSWGSGSWADILKTYYNELAISQSHRGALTINRQPKKVLIIHALRHPYPSNDRKK